MGLAISQSLILTGLVQYGIRQSTEVISQMTSVERVLQYTNLPKEGPFTTDKPPPATWPSKGGLTFKNVSMKYADNKQLVLKVKSEELLRFCTTLNVGCFNNRLSPFTIGFKPDHKSRLENRYSRKNWSWKIIAYFSTISFNWRRIAG